MGKNNNKIIDAIKEEYSFDMIFNDIQSELLEDNNNSETGNKFRLEYGSMLIVIQMILNLAKSYKTENYKDDETLNNDINKIVKDNELLDGYIFFVSQKPQFNHLWSYMRWCKESYKEFLANSIRFFNNILVDINILIKKPELAQNIHVVFNDILDVKLIREEPFVRTRLLWENLYHLATIKGDYHICVKVKDSVLKVVNRKNPSDTKILINAVLQEIENNSLD